MKDQAASVRARLRNLAEKQGKSFNLITLLYMQEGFLHRISSSPHADSFILKGGLLLYSRSQFTGRPTRDIDLLGSRISHEVDRITSVLSEVLSIDIDDSLVFDTFSLFAERIIEGAEYEGLRVKVNCRLGVIRNSIQIDIGFGDPLFPGPVNLPYPSLLDSRQFSVCSYPLESVVAEKFEVMISLAEMNSRMKDFYDVYYILTTENLSGQNLTEAITRTFRSRGTPLPENPSVFTLAFSGSSRNRQLWKGFLKRTTAEPIDFPVVMDALQKNLEPVYRQVREKLSGWEFSGDISS